MNRVIPVSSCLPLTLGTAIYSLRVADTVENEINRLTLPILEASDREDKANLMADARALYDYWDKEEKRLSHFVRHNQVEALGQSLARIPALAEYGTPAELQSEIWAVRWQMESIKRSEAFTFGNIW